MDLLKILTGNLLLDLVQGKFQVLQNQILEIVLFKRNKNRTSVPEEFQEINSLLADNLV